MQQLWQQNMTEKIKQIEDYENVNDLYRVSDMLNTAPVLINLVYVIYCNVSDVKQMMQEIGNSRARAVYEANVPDDFRRPQSD